jgi:hypothetical protein
MAGRARVSCTVDGTTFPAVEAVFEMNTGQDNAGMPALQTLTTSLQVRFDLHDKEAIPFDKIQKLFNLANVATRDKVKDVKIEYWDDDTKQNVICAFKFKGWISSFRTSNVNTDVGDTTFNHILDIRFTPVVNQANYKEVQISN